MFVAIHVDRQNELAQVASARRAPGSFLCVRQRREQQRRQNRDDGNDDQQFDQRERPLLNDLRVPPFCEPLHLSLSVNTLLRTSCSEVNRFLHR